MVMLAHCNRLLPWQFSKYIYVYTGFTGVELFFVLSGFLIGSILFRSFYNETIPVGTQLKNFWISRWLRTLPLYYLLLLFNFLFYNYALKLPAGNWRYLFFLQSIHWPTTNFLHPGFFGESWSLAVEEWFYLLFPLLIFQIAKFSRGNEGLKRVLFCTIVFIIIELILKFWVAYTTNFYWGNVMYKPTILRLDSCAYGIILACIVHFNPQFKISKVGMWIIIPLLILMVLLCLYQIYLPDLINYRIVKVIVFPANSLFCVLAINYFRNISIRNEVFKKTIVILSLCSYSLYLIHLPIETTLNGLVLHAGLPKNLALFLYFILPVAAAFLMFRFFELPVLNYRNSILKKPLN